MKAGWQSRKLGELCSIELGKTPSRSNKAFWDQSRQTNNVWLSIADLLNAEEGLISDSKEYLSDAGAALCKVVRAGTLLVSFKLTLGRLAFAGQDLFTNEAIAALGIFDEKELSKEFLFYFFHFYDWRKAAENDVKLKGMTLNKAKLKEIVVSFPEPAEQQRIVAILDEAFAGIASARAAAAQNLQNARAFFGSHLQSVFSQDGDDWLDRQLGDIFHIGSSKRVYEKEWTSSGVPFYGGREVVKLAMGMSPVISAAHISEEKYLELASQYDMPQAGDILMTARGTIGVGYVVKDGDRFYYKDGNIISFRAKTPTNPWFILFAFKTKLIRDQITRLTGTTVKHLPIEKANALTIKVPDLAAQNALVEQLERIENESKDLEALYQRKLDALDELKKSLLHQAFRGQL